VYNPYVIRKIFKKIFIAGSHIFDFLPANHKWKFAKLLPQRYSRRFMQYSRVQKFRWKLGGENFLLKSGPEDDYFLLSYKQEFKNWDCESISTWMEMTKDGELVIDVGAYVGIYTLLASRVGGSLKVIAIEPNPITVTQLTENLEMNGRSNTKIYNCAISAREGKRNLLRPANRKNSSSVQLEGANNLFDVSNWESQEVETRLLDNLIPEVDYEKISAIKVDVEGFEVEVLKSAVGILGKAHPELLIEALSVDDLVEIENFLLSFGYGQGKPLDGLRLTTLHSDATQDSKLAKNYHFK
jgi:FkbM family methyltransferase